MIRAEEIIYQLTAPMNTLRHVWHPAAVGDCLPRVLRALLLLLSGILLVLPANAQDVVQRVTLERALEMFAQNNLELRIARAGVSEMSGLARQAAAYPNPGVEITHEPLSEGGDTQSESYFNLSQRIEWPSLRSARTEAANRYLTIGFRPVRLASHVPEGSG